MSSAQKSLLSLYFIRHGQTEWSLSGRHTGRTDISLTAHDEDEARGLMPWLARIRFSRVLTSPRQRARRTCELAGLGQRPEIEPDLAEWDYGDYEGKLSSHIRMGRPDWNAFRDGCPNGEMPAQVSARADRLIGHLCTMDGNVALFSHGEFGLVLVARWIGMPVIEGQHFLLGTASLSILRYNPAHPEVQAIALWNATPALLLPGDGMTGRHSQALGSRRSLSD
jgi:probable phosphoglycerate mutase